MISLDRTFDAPSRVSPASSAPDRSSSLSPVPDSGSPRNRNSPPPDPPDPVQNSRQSTPLSELSPPPDDEPEQEEAKPEKEPEESTSESDGSSKAVLVLELNHELLKVCMEFQSRGITASDVRFQQYASRLQSNLAWLGSAADQTKPHSILSLPSMEPPAPVDFMSMERIQQIYTELPLVFSKHIARRQQLLNTLPPPAVNGTKRERTEESPFDAMNKRRDTGETKTLSAMLPPPTPLSASPPNGSAGPIPNRISPPIPQIPDPVLSNPPLSMTADPQRQSPVRPPPPQQPQRPQIPPQVSPPAPLAAPPLAQQSALAQNIPSTSPTNPNNNIAAQISNMPPQVQQMYYMLQNPNNQFVQYMHRHVPNFGSMSVKEQLHKMLMAQNALRGHQQQSNPQMMTNSMSNMGQMPSAMSNPMQVNGALPPSQFPNQQSPISPVNAQMGQPSQNMMMNNNGGSGIDPRMAVNNPQMTAGNMGMPSYQQQRQYMLLQQQQQQARGSVGNLNQGMMTPQQQQILMQQRLAQQAQQQPQHPPGGSPHLGSPMLGGNENFPALRSNSTIPGIARSTRSPPENVPSPMTPIMSTRSSSLGPEDYQRMMMQQQHQQQQHQQHQQQQQQVRGMGGFNQQLQATNWQQQQAMQQMAVQNQYGGGMGQPGAAGQGGGGSYGRVPSPSSQNWSQGGTYPFSPSPGHQSDLGQTPSHMSATPGPQMQSQIGPDQQSMGDFDLFASWGHMQ